MKKLKITLELTPVDGAKLTTEAIALAVKKATRSVDAKRYILAVNSEIVIPGQKRSRLTVEDQIKLLTEN